MNDPAPLPPPGKLPEEPFAIAGVDGSPLRLEELVDRRALAEMITSFEHLFGVPIRVLTAAGKTLAGNETFSPLCGLVNEQPAGERACADVLDVVKHLDFTAAPISATVPTGVHRCFTGAQYRVIPLEYDRRLIGRILLGPYLLLKKDRSAGDPPRTLAALSPELGSHSYPFGLQERAPPSVAAPRARCRCRSPGPDRGPPSPKDAPPGERPSTPPDARSCAARS